ncbi:RING finger domain protein [Xylogone sp. PMI_703]|nr:RING finger domain protein [Xylogone sp. PMI_703]
MSSASYRPRATWSWTSDMNTPSPRNEEIPIPGAFMDDGPEKPEHAPPKESKRQPPKPRKHYPPRTCRICLEVVLPTFEPAPEGVASMFNPTPSVSYISSDPESGRLIRPCKCKGSSRWVHEGCLQQWRHADPSYGRRNFWECPTCGFRYRLERLRWGRWISSTVTQILLTIGIFLATTFVLGFIADPIIDFYMDPLDTITSIPLSGKPLYVEEPATWSEHFLKGFASLGLIGCIKAFFAMGPWNWWSLRNALGGSGGRRRGTGRDRLENLSWHLALIGVITFLYAVWKWVRAWSRRTLEKSAERVLDVHGDDDDDDDDE